LHEEARRHAGFGTAGSETKAERDNGLKLISWPHNALRHSFASYHLAKFQNASALALEMGHANSSLIFAHYRELVLPKTAEAYWSLSLDHVSLSRE
jgi:integrase